MVKVPVFAINLGVEHRERDWDALGAFDPASGGDDDIALRVRVRGRVYGACCCCGRVRSGCDQRDRGGLG